MALQTRVTLRAASQIEKADSWWLGNRPSAPNALRNDLAAALDLLVRHPNVGTEVASTKVVGVRRLHLGRIRYHIYYRVKESELVVLAFWHSSRGSSPVL
ncbi:MAG: type II toxin-antitoxin system RelE/ParE family toxin [Pseudomonadota bacterium]|nr:type II toxin-antitoxin system RelE/ParE family toxin [Pseudomonadota bacterium]